MNDLVAFNEHRNDYKRYNTNLIIQYQFTDIRKRPRLVSLKTPVHTIPSQQATLTWRGYHQGERRRQDQNILLVRHGRPDSPQGRGRRWAHHALKLLGMPSYPPRSDVSASDFWHPTLWSPGRLRSTRRTCCKLLKMTKSESRTSACVGTRGFERV